MLKISCIYSITNTVNGRAYYGSTINWYARKANHICHLRKGKHANTHLQRAWNHYGEQAFVFAIEIELPLENLLDVEQAYLDNNTDGYNMAAVAGRAIAPGAKRDPAILKRAWATRKTRGYVPYNKGAPKDPERVARGRATWAALSQEQKNKAIANLRKGNVALDQKNQSCNTLL